MAMNSTLSLMAVTTIFFSRLLVPSLGVDACTPGKGCNYVDESQAPIKYLMVGNPGTGKSTMLNGLASKPLFQSGLSYGSVKTVVHQSEQIGKDWYMDTPGLSDIKRRGQNAREIEEALNEGGAYKVVFVITLEAGVVRPEDRTTMELILRSAPIMHYGVMINKLGKRERGMLLNNTYGAYDAVVTGLMSGLPTKSLYFHFKARDEDLVDEENAVPDLDEQFVRFMQNIPAVEIKPEEVKAIDVNEYDELGKKFEIIIDELYRDKKKLREEVESGKHEYRKIIEEMQRRSDEIRKNPHASTSASWAKDIIPLIPVEVSALTSNGLQGVAKDIFATATW